jgi:hypothetical protein
VQSGGLFNTEPDMSEPQDILAEQERLIAQLQSMLDRCSEKLWVEWVPTEEQLPVKDGEVLVAWDQHEKVAVGYFGNGKWQIEAAEYGPPTHWMPLPIGPRPPVPEPPTECP